jgi:hypothetical protein
MQLPRTWVRSFRAVLRKSRPAGAVGGVRPALVLAAGRDGLHLHVHFDEVVVSYHQRGSFTPETLALSSEALVDFEGQQQDVVVLQALEAGLVQARWHEDGVPQVKDYPAWGYTLDVGEPTLVGRQSLCPQSPQGSVSHVVGEQSVFDV